MNRSRIHRGKRKWVPRLRATAHLRSIAKTATQAADFLQGHRLQASFRRHLYRELRDAQILIRHVYEEVIGQI